MEFESNSAGKNTDKKLIIIIAILIIIIAVLTILLCLNYTGKRCESPACLEASHQILSLMNMSQDPCDDFFDFVCANFNQQYPDQHSIVSIAKKRFTSKFELLFRDHIRPDDSPKLKLQKKYFKLCINETAIEQDQNKMFLKIINKLGGWPLLEGNNWDPNNFDLLNFLTTCRNLGINFEILFSFDLTDEDHIELSLPNGVNTIDEKERYKYVNVIRNVAVDLGSTSLLQFATREIMAFESKLGNIIDAAINETASENYAKPKFTVKDLKQIWNLNWDEFIKNITLRDYDVVILGTENYFFRLKALIEHTSRKTLANFLIWKISEHFSPYLNSTIRSRFREYKDIVSNGQVTREHHNMTRKELCLFDLKNYFAASPIEYIKRYVPKSKVKKAMELFQLVRSRLRYKIKENEWMDEETKELALQKLGNMTYTIGSVDDVYDNERTNGDLSLVNLNTSNVIELILEIQKQLIDNYFQNTSKVVASNVNQIYFAAHFVRGIFKMIVSPPFLEQPFLDEDRPNYLNFGTLASIMGHELIHGFDMANDWLVNRTRENLAVITSCFKNCNDGLKTKENCTRTFNENLADFTGVNLSYEAYQEWLLTNGVEPGLIGLPFNSNQLFWIAYANLMCTGRKSTREEIKTDYYHMLPRNRIMASFRNSKYFANDFHCAAGSNMNPIKKCQYF